MSKEEFDSLMQEWVESDYRIKKKRVFEPPVVRLRVSESFLKFWDKEIKPLIKFGKLKV